MIDKNHASFPNHSPVLSFSDFTFRYRAQKEPTLHDINLTVNKGEKILILGQSGSGKSTLIHCINGIIPHAFKGESSGVLMLSGKDSKNLDIFEISKMAGTVLQDTDGQFVGLSAAEDIAFALENDCVPADEIRRRAADTALLVDMTAHLEKSPHDLSGGQKQRISIAGVLVDDVEILIFDEPLANLDPAAGKDTMELIDDLHKQTGKTIIIVEHRLEDVLHRSLDRIIVMEKGRIISNTPPERLIASSILSETGIREPLYITALKYAGIKMEENMLPHHLDSILCDYSRLAEWDNQLIINDEIQKFNNEHIGNVNENTALDVRNIRFRYDEQGEDALKDISFSVANGECIGLVGRNGSGKSTLAKCVCGFIKQDSGDLFFNGQNIDNLSIMQRAEKIGYVMQNPNQMISFPMIFDETAFGLRTRGAGEAEVKSSVHEALEICGLYPFRNWPVSALSYGQKKRLTIASILVLRPSFMILDEPTAGQDYRHYTEFMEFLIALNRKLGLSLVLITHDMHLMLEYTTRAVVLSQGQLVADDEPFKILTNDEIINKANLKRTSLYELALNAGLKDARGFVERYIRHDREKRMEKERK
ncbi:MAG: ABC transporter ATP-binding protein [Treponema sp.]|nr:ABC transporter ATP-binding protein [Treponema sp.]